MTTSAQSAQEGETPQPTSQTKQSAGHGYAFIPLKSIIIFPGAKVTLNIGREKSLLAVQAAMAGNRRVVTSAQRLPDEEHPGADDVFDVGTLGRILHQEDSGEGTIQIVIEGISRARITGWLTQDPFPQVEIEEVADPEVDAAQATALGRHAHSLFDRFSHLSRRFSAEDIATIGKVHDASGLADALAGMLTTDYAQLQDLLETFDPLARLEKICVSLGNEIEIVELENKIRQRVRQQVDKNQREYYLKEQLRAIQEELGQDQASEIAELRERVAKKGLPSEVAVKVNKELDRLERMPSHSAEMVVLRNYIDWVLALPWKEHTEDRLDMTYAQKILDEDHYGLDKVKDRIVEFLAVRQLRQMQAQRHTTAGGRHDDVTPMTATSNKGPILCLIGPPGVGKTSLGQSVARALGRKLVRISLGGVHDEAEIRGHRRTYVGALPGRIIQAMKTAGVCNPVFLLDEVDKLTSDYRGDPSAALLEVLDPAQNSTFTDHYLEVPYDLSQVFFICTGNNRYQIPRALADRMDMVEIPGYTEEEKVAIGRNFVLPKVLQEHGLSRAQVQIPESSMRYIISRYTREAGVRSLERQIATICRKAARRIVEKPNAHIRVTEKNVEQYLGVARYTPDKPLDRGQVGVATGLAWTEHGGTLLPVEVVTMPGKGGLLITGQLGEVMQESARAAISFIRSRAARLGLPEDFQDNLDIHIHLPEGAIPKDGPSAGITMATAVVSALTSRPVRSDLAMTGEITLRGRVLPIGGLKEKALAAHRVGIRNLLVPAENDKDLAEIPAKVRGEMNISLVETMDEVISHALLEKVSEEDVRQPEQQHLPPAPSLYPVPTAGDIATSDSRVVPPSPTGTVHEGPQTPGTV